MSKYVNSFQPIFKYEIIILTVQYLVVGIICPALVNFVS